METPSFIEDHISQIPALQILMKLGYRYLTPSEALEARGGRNSNVLLEQILKQQLQIINKIEYKNKEFEFSEGNVNAAILALRDLPIQDGFLSANRAFYELITLGKSFEQNVLGDKKSFSFHYVDWKNPENNVFHVAEEFSVLRTGLNDTYRPDIVLFINGIPMVVIECKSPKVKDPVAKAIEQHARNQQENGIRSLYYYSNLVIGLAVHEALYATTATSKEFWSVWKEIHESEEEKIKFETALQDLKDGSLPEGERTLLFQERYSVVLRYFNKLEKESLTVTEQDRLLYSLCRKDRLLDLIYHFILFDDGVKKITRYQQYFAVRKTLKKVAVVQPDGSRTGGVIWHTQGSGKSLTMVMMAELIAVHPEIKNPKILLVTDRIDLDDQITETFKKCGKEVKQATKGASQVAIKKFAGQELSGSEEKAFQKDTSLLGLLQQKDDAIVTTLVHKFTSAVSKAKANFPANNIFILVDEGHRSHYSSLGVKIRQVFPNACFIAFTGTPLMKREKSTAEKFGGMIDIYSINDAVEDKAVVPLLYEGRHNLMSVNERPLDTFFDRVSEPLTEYGKAALKKRFSTRNAVVQSIGFIENTAWDIAKHFEGNIRDTGFKGQLVAPNKLSAIRYREVFKEIGKVSVEVLISAPDIREGEEDAFEVADDKVKTFWKAMMDKYGKAETYEKSIINAFKKQDQPEIIVVVDKLLTGFDAPLNQVLYLTRNLKEHTLLQAIARVNRLAPGKDYGYIIDYYGNLENLDNALATYSGMEEFEDAELAGTLVDIKRELAKLPQAHSELWDVFKEVKNKYDEPAYEELLSDEAKRYSFYDKLSVFARLLKLALSNYDFAVSAPEKQVIKYKNDAKFFLGLRVSVKRRYSDDVDYREYEPQVQKLIDKHITSDGTLLTITDSVNIFNKAEREAEVEKLSSKAAKADHIASRTIKAISLRMNDDPALYKRLSELIKQTIEEYRQQRIDEAEYLARAKDLEKSFLEGKLDSIPSRIKDNGAAVAFYNLAMDEFKQVLEERIEKTEISTEIAEGIDQVILSNIIEQGKPVVDWQNNIDIEGRIKIEIDDLLFDTKSKYDLNINFDLIDNLIAECLKVAKIKYDA